MSPTPDARRHEQALRDFALSFPEAREEFPWGERVVKVRGKIFVFLGAGGETLSVTTKLPRSHVAALDFGFTEPTGYGLGKSGWITARFDGGETPPLDTLFAWIEESYSAVAPKKLSAARRAAKASESRADDESPRTPPTSNKKARGASRSSPRSPGSKLASRGTKRAVTAPPKPVRGAPKRAQTTRKRRD